MITAWDATTGVLRWQQTNVVFVSATALVNNTHDLFLGGGNQATAFNLQSGARQWSIQGDPGETVQQLSVKGDLVLIRTDASLTAVQAETGKTIWHRESQVQALFIDPMGIMYTVFLDVTADSTSSGLRAVRLSTDVQLWKVSFPIHNGESGSLSSIGIVWTSKTSITAWDLSGRQLWQLPYTGKLIEHVANSDTQHFFLFVSQDGTVTALDAQDGHQRWRQGILRCSFSQHGSG